MVRVRNYVSAKSLGNERAQAAMFSWIVDVYIQIPCHIDRATRSTLDFGSSSSSARVYYCSLSYARDLFQVLPTPFVIISTTNTAIRRGHIWCDVGCGTASDERAGPGNEASTEPRAQLNPGT